MDNGSIIDIQFNEAFNEANALYEQDQLEECIAKARALLAEPAIPRYHHMKTLILLAATTGDWEEAYEARLNAEALWIIVRRSHPQGEDNFVDTYMGEIRESLDELKEILQKEHMEHIGHDADDVTDRVAAHDEAIADAEAMMEVWNLDEGDEEVAIEAETSVEQQEDLASAYESKNWFSEPQHLLSPPPEVPHTTPQDAGNTALRTPPPSPAVASSDWQATARPIRGDTESGTSANLSTNCEQSRSEP